VDAAVSAAASMAWKLRNRDRVRQANRVWVAKKRKVVFATNQHITAAFIERFGVRKSTVRAIGTSVLCLCRSDEARRILLGVSK
jgi:hypothetical protein